MMRRMSAALLLVAMGACGRQRVAMPETPAFMRAVDPAAAAARDGLVTAERAFAARSIASGTRDAFLAYLADDAVLFIPRAAPGRPFFEQQPTTPTSRLEWAPIYAEVSGAGDLGFTTGPYEARANPAIDSVTAYGNFVSIWKRDAASSDWKVAVDLGTTNQRPPAARRLRAARGASVSSRSVPGNDSDTGATSGIGGRALTPLGADSIFAMRAAAGGTAAALALAASDVRLHRDGREPVVGRESAAESLRRAGERFAWHPAAGVEAQSADLGYTYGTFGGIAPGAAEAGAYVRIWRRGSDGRWRLALDITNPFPP